jgi:hypothetical protein
MPLLALLPTGLCSMTYRPPPSAARSRPASSMIDMIAGSWSVFTKTSPCTTPISFMKATIRLVMYVFVDFEGTTAASVILVVRSRMTNTGTVFPGSLSSPKKQRSACNSGMPGSSCSFLCGSSLPRPRTQWRHQLRNGK